MICSSFIRWTHLLSTDSNVCRSNRREMNHRWEEESSPEEETKIEVKDTMAWIRTKAKLNRLNRNWNVQEDLKSNKPLDWAPSEKISKWIIDSCSRARHRQRPVGDSKPKRRKTKIEENDLEEIKGTVGHLTDSRACFVFQDEVSNHVWSSFSDTSTTNFFSFHDVSIEFDWIVSDLCPCSSVTFTMMCDSRQVISIDQSPLQLTSSFRWHPFRFYQKK